MYKMITHAFVDGFSREVVGIKVNSNNRPDTVLKVFDSATESHGFPRRVRGDYGAENLGVANKMETRHGLNRGSYICGRYAELQFCIV